MARCKSRPCRNCGRQGPPYLILQGQERAPGNRPGKEEEVETNGMQGPEKRSETMKKQSSSKTSIANEPTADTATNEKFVIQHQKEMQRRYRSWVKKLESSTKMPRSKRKYNCYSTQERIDRSSLKIWPND
ncbi:hypothetical protein KIN20_023203 [Parelaphostrongylus tenuis]|uniref:Uncharacterized protein n=1 Tax=Parelaphostrongylus tenuis TaxID=148309 RepID=A0AAD5QX78_PARTN|nr:hypothetical protein KIN20_023203 [Parelaphostrongylus tenuis]